LACFILNYAVELNPELVHFPHIFEAQ